MKEQELSIKQNLERPVFMGEEAMNTPSDSSATANNLSIKPEICYGRIIKASILETPEISVQFPVLSVIRV